jgi:hypothetical protein
MYLHNKYLSKADCRLRSFEIAGGLRRIIGQPLKGGALNPKRA